MNSQDLIGVYALKSFTIEANGEKPSPWGSGLRGLLIYTNSGYMSVSINRDPPSPKPADWEPLDDLLFYSGTYEVGKDFVIHHVTQATDTDRIGKDMKRSASFDGRTLTLSNPTASGGAARVVWQKKA